MSATTALEYRQPSLLGIGEPHRNPMAGVTRIALNEASWLDWCPGWLHGGDALFDWCHRHLPWSGGERVMYDRIVAEPRLTASVAGEELPPVLADLADHLTRHCGRTLDRVFANLYRDGRDSVAWHGDRIRRRQPQSVIPVLSLGGPRTFAVRPTAGGPARHFEMHSGDLLVMGGACQHTHEHAVPKRHRAEPRISLTFRSPDDERLPEVRLRPVGFTPTASSPGSSAAAEG